MQPRKPHRKEVVDIRFILALLSSLASSAKEDYASRASGAYYAVATRRDYDSAVVADLEILRLAHDCSRAIAMYDGGYYTEFLNRTIKILKDKGEYTQDIHNALALFSARLERPTVTPQELGIDLDYKY